VSRVRGALTLLAATAVALSAAHPAASLAEPPLKDSGIFFQPQLGAPGLSTIIGASPGEAPGEVWAIGNIGPVPATLGAQLLGNARVLLHRSRGTGWQILPITDAAGNPLSFTDTPQVTYNGGVAMLSGSSTGETIITRDPGGAFVIASEAPPLLSGEELSNGSQPPLMSAIDDEAHTGALLVPSVLSPQSPAVLHFDGSRWAREPLCTTYSPGASQPCTVAHDLSPLAIAASSPQNAWLLASGPGVPLALFRRVAAAGSGALWEEAWTPDAEEKVSQRTGGQMLTVTSSGVWVDARFERRADLALLIDHSTPGHVIGRWCYPQVCGGSSLGAPLPEEYSSFASAGGGPLGTRVISGLPDGGLLRFQGGGDFRYVVGPSGNSQNAAFFGEELEEGWLSGVSGGHDGARVERVSTSPEATLGTDQTWPLPFRRPLLAIAPQPGSSPGDPAAEALAVGDDGQIARYLPGTGWTPEFLYNGANGVVQHPRLRGVAWPEAGRAYAVGDEGAMWLWRSDTGLWEPDPAAPLGLHANLMAIAFSPLDPAVGYAVGKQGALLAYDKTWTQQPLPPGLAQADFTSVSFAGSEALATYRMVKTGSQGEPEGEVGGLIVNDGTGWRIDPSAQALLAHLSNPAASVLSKVSGLPDGGAVAAGPEVVIERDSAGSGWRFSRQPLTEAQNVSALAAIRAGSEVRALVSIDLSPQSNPNDGSKLFLNIDTLPPPALGQPPGLVGPDPIPATGYLLRETGEGWQDLEQQAYPMPSTPGVTVDLPAWPAATLALDVDASGNAGWAVGGQTGGQFLEGIGGREIQSAQALRLGPGAAPPQSTAPIATPSGEATFAVGGNAQCEGPCVNLLNEGAGPDVWLSKAAATAANIPGLRGFLYTGARVADTAAREMGPEEFTRELQAYREDLSAAGSLPVHAAASPSDLDSLATPATFDSVLGSFAPAGSAPGGTPAPPAGSAAYAFDSAGAGGTVRVIVLDYSRAGLGQAQLGWLREQLAYAQAAQVPAIVIGHADVAMSDGVHAPDAAGVERVLLEGGASAYLFDSPGENRFALLGSGSNSIPAFGTGTLGYVPDPVHAQEFLGASGLLLVSVDPQRRNARTNRAPVSATLTPSISQLALDATDGTLLRRSQAALFEGLARRPFAGLASIERQVVPNPYVPIPENCKGERCGAFIEPDYTFHSSDEEVGQFVAPERASASPRAVLQGPDGKPVPDEHSGLFCAYNPGQTTVSITTGGLTYSEQVTVQAGSVEQPCGTVPLKSPPVVPAALGAAVASPPSAPAAGSSPTPVTVVPPPPPPPPAPARPAPPPPPPPPPPRPPAATPSFPFLPKPPLLAPLILIPLVPPPAVARPTPPSGTSAVAEPATAPEEQEEEEEATESARANMAAYNRGNPALSPLPLIALVLIAAAAGTGIRRGRRRRGIVLARAGARGPERRW
jgi:hypothetical protein